MEKTRSNDFIKYLNNYKFNLSRFQEIFKFRIVDKKYLLFEDNSKVSCKQVSKILNDKMQMELFTNQMDLFTKQKRGKK